VNKLFTAGPARAGDNTGTTMTEPTTNIYEVNLLAPSPPSRQRCHELQSDDTMG
jgi:hypothetical protein